MDKNEITYSLFQSVEQIIEEARLKIANSINSTMCETYYNIGKMIIMDEQKGTGTGWNWDRTKYE